MRFLLVLWLLVLSFGVARAEPGVSPREPALIVLMQSLPEATLKRLRKAPDKFLAEASVLIHGYGQNGAIGPAGLERFIALARAEARARAMGRLLVADLDNDGVIAMDEVASVADAASAAQRGRLRLAYDAADLDGDGDVTMAEARARAEIEALDKLSEADADTLRGFMACDLDGDGRVSLAEVDEVSRLLSPRT